MSALAWHLDRDPVLLIADLREEGVPLLMGVRAQEVALLRILGLDREIGGLEAVIAADDIEVEAEATKAAKGCSL